MTTTIKRHWRILLASTLAIVFVATTLIVQAVDSDNDGMDDVYEWFFGLDTTTNDAAADPDADTLSNMSESLLWTDPFAADTDQDGFADSADSNAVSRAFTPWGSPYFTHPDGTVLYTWPLWMQLAWAENGLWLTNIPCGWHSPAAETNPAALYMEIDRAGIESNLVLNVAFLDHADSTLFLDIFDTNDTVTASALYGNLLAGTGTETNRILEIPFAANPAATGIRLRKGVGDVTILGSLLYVDADLDGLDADQEAQLGTSDFLVDSDGDGLSDHDEVFIHGTNPADADTDGDGIGDGIELRMGLDPLVAGNYSPVPFTEGFEPPVVHTGDLTGQNNWEVNLPGVAIVQTNEVFAGTQALKVAGDFAQDDTPSLRHIFANAPSVVWMDIRQKVFAAAIPEAMPDSAAIFLFDANGHLVVSDGTRPVGQQFVTLTNAPALEQGAWARITIRADYDSQTWLVCLDGLLVAQDLGFASPQERFTVIDIEGHAAVMDDMYVGASRPGGLSTVPGNQIPDDWYLLYLGSIGTDTGDPDSDGLTNLHEYQLGTNPNSTDTDGDGISDQSELQLGRNPLVADTLSMLPFTEGFEQPLVMPGDLTGQNNWIANRPAVALVQTSELFSGVQGLKLLNESDDDTPVSVNHVFTDTPSVVWIDIRQQVIAAALPESTAEAAALLCFNADGHLVVLDGSRPEDQCWVVLTNMPAIPQGEWTRITMRLDYTTQTWLICLNGVLAADNLGFASPQSRLQSVRFDGQSAVMDDIYVGASQPSGISTIPGNQVPDEWYIQYFGILGQIDGADPDGDGLTSLQEYAFGTNPTLADTDADGVDDASETTIGSDPLAALSYPIAMSGTISYTGSQTGTLWLVAQSAAGVISNALDLVMPETSYSVSNFVSRRDYNVSAFIDTNNEGTPDPWEPTGAFPVNPIVNPTSDVISIIISMLDDQNVDSDGDGLSDYDEFYTYGSDPTRIDTSGDGLPDGWLVANGFDPADPSVADSDTDGDGLTNAVEYEWGFDPRNGIADNDGDGLPDEEEIHLFGTSPLSLDSDADGTNDVVMIWQTDGTNTTHRHGLWTNDAATLVALQNHYMRAEYTLTVSNAGMHRLVFDITNAHAQPADGARFTFQILIDNIPAGWITTPAFDLGSPTSGSPSLTTPWLTAGEHTIRIAWLDDYAAGKLLGIQSVALQRVDGADNDLSGIADWEEWVLDQGYDTDTDGLSDLDEISFQVSGLIPHPSLNPLSSDTDTDTLDDGFELTADLSPLTSDSDGDGIPDAVLLATRRGVETSYRQVVHITKVWKEDGNTLYNPKSGILISYDFTVTNAGMHRLAFDLRNYQADPPDNYRFKVEVLVNGRSVGTRYVRADLDRTGTGYINTPWLTPGTHTISLKWLNDQDGGGRYTTIAVEELRLYAFDSPDANGDGIQDWQAAALQSAGDSDGDGISDFLEVTVYGTSPVLTDTDGDGLRDNLEINAVSAFGLSAALNPLSADSDADGVSDWQEIYETLTDPLIAEFGASEVVDTIVGSEFVSSSSNWYATDTAVIARNRRGFLEYEINCPTGDVYFLEVTATHILRKMTCTPISPVDTSDLLISVDGVYVGKRALVAPDGIDGKVGIFMPWLSAGTHNVQLFWENVHEGVSLKLGELRILRFDGPDVNLNGVRDWLEVYLDNMTGLDPVNTTSVVSPVCIEGSARYVPLVAVNTSSSTNAIPVNPGIMGRWYSDVQLAATGTTQIAASFQSGILVKPASITWTALNLLEDGGEAMIRAGDSLKLTAVPAGATNGTVTIQGGGTNYTTDVATPVILTFPEAGTYTIAGSFTPSTSNPPPSTVSNSLVLTVVAVAFPTNPPACMVGKTRAWSCPDIPPQAVLQADSTVVLGGSNTAPTIRMTKINRDHGIIARLGQNGPILARQHLDGFWIQAAVDGYVQMIKEYETSQLWEQYMVTKLIPDSVDIEISIFIGGVTFADDMTTTRWITADDLSELGEYTFSMIHPNSVSASVCHRIKAYENGIFLGEAYYSEVLMPLE